MQSSVNVLNVNRPAKVPPRPIALPVEHGAWGFLFEPLAAGLILAPAANETSFIAKAKNVISF